MSTSTTTDAALAAWDAGLCPIRGATDGTKRPLGQWRDWQATRPDRDTVEVWFADGHPALGLVCGQVSGGLEMFEFEGRALPELSQRFGDTIDAAGLGDLWAAILSGYSESTPSGGMHVLWRCAVVEGNLKLAANASGAVLLETRGEGGFVIVAPSNGTTHPTGKAWQLLDGAFDRIVEISPEERADILAVARSFDLGEPTHVDEAPRPSSSGNAGEAFDAANTTDGVFVAAGYTLTKTDRSGDRQYTRPGKDPRHGTSATVWARDGRATLWSSSIDAPREYLDGHHRLTPWRLHVALNHAGDYTAAARQWHATHPDNPLDQLTAGLSPNGTQTTTEPGLDDDMAAGATWRPTDLTVVLAALRTGTRTAAVPTLGRIGTGELGLWYAGRVNGLYGESGKGKSWVAVAVAAEILTDGGSVVWIDLEEPAEGIVARLCDLGVDEAAILGRFVHLAPEEAIANARDTGELTRLLVDVDPTLAVIDSTGEALALEGVKPNNDDEVARWFRGWARWIANVTGAGVVAIDHVAKDETTRGLHAIGSQRKRAAVNGAAFMVEAIRELGRGQEGQLKLTTAKDRQGWHRNGTRAAEFTLDATSTPTSWRLDPPERDPSKPWRPTIYMERISRWLEERPDEWIAKSPIEGAIEGRAATIREALRLLVAEGYVDRRPAGSSDLHRHVKRYTELSEMT